MNENERILAAIREMDGNLTITDEIARHAAAGFTAHTAHMLVIFKVIETILRKYPVNLRDIRSELRDPVSGEISAAALVAMDSLIATVEGGG